MTGGTIPHNDIALNFYSALRSHVRDRGCRINVADLTLPTLQEYVLIDSEKVNVECFRRGEGRLWLYTPYAAGDTLTLASIEFTGAIDLLYEDVQLPT